MSLTFPIANYIHNLKIRKKSARSFKANWHKNPQKERKTSMKRTISSFFVDKTVICTLFPLISINVSKNYNGFLEGVPAFLGYFFGVPLTFSMEINDLPESPSENLWIFSTFPPRRKILDFAAFTSSSQSPDL